MLKIKLIIPLLVIVAGILILILAAEESSGGTIIVAQDGSGEYENIQEAIDAADVGDTIRVYEGTFEENVVVDKSVSLIGNGSDSTTVNGGGSGNVVKIEVDGVNMDGFMVTGSGGAGYPIKAGIYVYYANATLTNNSVSENYNGIYLFKSNDCTITDNTCLMNEAAGISLGSSNDCMISNNSCTDNGNGIYLSYSDYSKILNNTCANNINGPYHGTGIYLGNSNDCTITDNTCLMNGDSGISLSYSSDCGITNNTCANNNYGLVLSYSNDCTITNNTMNENGIQISGNLDNWNSHTIDTSNTVNGKPVYYYKNVSDYTVPFEAGQFILANCTWMDVKNQDCNNGSVGIMVGYSSNITLENNTCSKNYYGISLSSSNNCIITNNICENNDEDGIILSSSSNCTISNNTLCNNSESGFNVMGSIFNEFSNNTCSNNHYGFQLVSSTYIRLEHNIISDNVYGIDLRTSSEGNTAIFNDIFNNTDYGINAIGNDGNGIEARNNWWGHGSGPNHPQLNPNGNGDNVTNDVLFNPWIGKSENWTWYVDDDGGLSDFIFIQDAVNASLDGDIIRVFNGTYLENIVVNTSINIIGNGSDETFIKGNHVNHTIMITTDWVNVTGLWIEDSNAGIFVDQSNFVTIYENTFYDNDRGIHLESAEHITLFNNTCTNNYRSLSLSYSINNMIQNNYGDENIQGIHFSDSNNNVLMCNEDPIILSNSNNNSLSLNCGMINLLKGSEWNYIENNTCSNNEYGILIKDSMYNFLINNTCINNEQGIYLDYADHNFLFNNTLRENIVGLYVRGYTSRNIVHHNIIHGNEEYGIQVINYSGQILNSTLNWWGHVSGPYHLSKNPQGMGDHITDNVEFLPWIQYPPLENYVIPVAFIDMQNPLFSIEEEEISMLGHGNAYDTIILYVWHSSIDGEFSNGSNSGFDYSDLSNGTHTISLNVYDNYGMWSADAKSSVIINGLPAASIDIVSPNPSLQGDFITFSGVGVDDGIIVQYVWRTDDFELYNGTDMKFQLSNITIGIHNIYFKVQDNYGFWSDEVLIMLEVLNDDDGDGIPDINDAFPNDENEWNDTDEDGVGDNSDAFPKDPIASKDTDSDGYPGEWNEGKTAEDSTTGLKLDEFPEDPMKWRKDDDNDDGDGGFIPGFGTVTVVGAVALGLVLYRRNGKRTTG